jgi:hypothetical protein
MPSTSNYGTILAASALILLLASNLFDLRRAHGQLETAREAQKTAITDSAKIETQLDALATGVAALARSGNANAQKIVEIMGRGGVNIGAK